jgi:hypothetical protein
LLGKACGRSSLRLESIIRLIKILKARLDQPISAESLMALIQALPEMDDVYTPLMRKGSSEARWSGEVSRKYGMEIARALQERAHDASVYYARCKRAAVLWAWTNGRPMGGIEADCTVNPFYPIGPGEVRNFADTTRYHLRSAFQIVTLLLMTEGPSEEAVDGLLKQLEIGIPASLLELISLPVTLTRGQYLALLGAGATTVSAVWSLPGEVLAKLIGPHRSAELEKHRPG